MSASSSRVAIALGTRRETVKFAGVIRLLGDRGYVVHSGQHYDDTLSQTFLDTYQIERPKIQLTVGSRDRSAR